MVIKPCHPVVRRNFVTFAFYHNKNPEIAGIEGKHVTCHQTGLPRRTRRKQPATHTGRKDVGCAGATASAPWPSSCPRSPFF